MADTETTTTDAPVAAQKEGAACKNLPKKTKHKSTKSADPKPETRESTPAESKTDLESKTDDQKNENLPEKIKEPVEDPEPEPRVYTPEEIEAIATKVETYKDQTPEYKPDHMLSPEFVGTSNYERAISEFRKEKLAELKKLDSDSNTTSDEISNAKDNIRILDHLYENYNLGMNVFRTAKGGRAKLRV